MWIHNTNEATRRLYEGWMDDYVGEQDEDEEPPLIRDLPGDGHGIVFDGPMQVTQEVGQKLIDHYDSVEEYEQNGDSE